jgi:acetyl esterase/lipase
MLLKGHDPTDPFANPLYANLTGFPPMYLSAGTEEALLDNPEQLAEAATKAHVDVVLKIADSMQHVYEFMAGSQRAAHAPTRIAELRPYCKLNASCTMAVRSRADHFR